MKFNTSSSVPIMNIEKKIITQLIKSQHFIAIYLKNGICLQGIIVYSDKDTLYLFNPHASNGQNSQQLVYKQAISSISVTPKVKEQAGSMKEAVNS